ncbi:hypothetical protein N7453_000778 [Penicillium expansum]|nr:hypothetical protein N7453_000778 [Penicillium expansum]
MVESILLRKDIGIDVGSVGRAIKLTNSWQPANNRKSGHSAHDICGKFIKFITTSDYADNNDADYVPIRVRSHPTASTAPSTGKSVT